MYIPSEVVDQIKARGDCTEICEWLALDIKNGRIRCPMHHGENYNCQVSKNYVYCHVCHQSADVIDLVKNVLQIRWADATVKLAEYYFVPVSLETQPSTEPTICLSAAALHGVGLGNKQRLKELHAKNEEAFWGLILASANAALIKYAAVETTGVPGLEIEKRKRIASVRQLIDLASRSHPTRYALKFTL